MTGYADDLISQLSASEGEPVNVTSWFNSYSFDVIGDLAFGKPFGMLKTGEKVFLSPYMFVVSTNQKFVASCSEAITRRHGTVRNPYTYSLGLSYPHQNSKSDG